MDFFVESKNFKKSGINSLGLYEGIYTKYNKSKGCHNFTFYFESRLDNFISDINDFRANNGEWFRDCIFYGENKIIRLSIPVSESNERAGDILSNALEYVKALELAPLGICAHCGAKTPDVIYCEKEDTIKAVCINCYKSPEVTGQYATTQVRTNSATGFIGSLVGALIGSIPYLLVAYFFDLYIGIVAFVIGICAFYGYKLLRGPKNAVTLNIMLVISTIISAAAANFLLFNYSVYNIFLNEFKLTGILYRNVFDVMAIIPPDTGLNIYMGKDKYSLFNVVSFPEIVTSAWRDMAVAVGIALLGVLMVQFLVKGYTAKKSGSGLVPIFQFEHNNISQAPDSAIKSDTPAVLPDNIDYYVEDTDKDIEGIELKEETDINIADTDSGENSGSI